MKLDKNNATIQKLVAIACTAVKYEKNVTVEEAIVQFIQTSSNDPKGHTKSDFFNNLKRLLFSESEIEMALHDLEQAGVIRIYAAHGPTFGGAVVYYRPTLDFMALMADHTGQKGRQTLANLPQPENLIPNTTMTFRSDTPWFVDLVNWMITKDAAVQYPETVIMVKLIDAEHINWDTVRLADVLHGQMTQYTRIEFEAKIKELIDGGVITRYEDGLIHYSAQFSSYMQIIVDYTRGKYKKPDLIKVKIQVKGMDVTLSELYHFYKNVLWLFETQKHLEVVYVGVIKLTKQEALELHALLKQQKAFE